MAVIRNEESPLRAAMGQMNLSLRGYPQVLKRVRAIVDLAGSDQIQTAHLAVAPQDRSKTMMV